MYRLGLERRLSQQSAHQAWIWILNLHLKSSEPVVPELVERRGQEDLGSRLVSSRWVRDLASRKKVWGWRVTLAAFSKDLGLIVSTHTAVHNHPNSRGSATLSGL